MNGYKIALSATVALWTLTGAVAAQTLQAPGVTGPAQVGPSGSGTGIKPSPVPIGYAGGAPNAPVSAHFSGPLAAPAQSLFDLGMRFDLNYSDQMLDNVSEGIPGKEGRFANTGKLSPGIWLDLQKIAGIADAQLHIVETFDVLKEHGGTGLYGFQSATNSGEMSIVHQNTTEPNTLTWASYDQKFLDRRLDIEVGRMNAQKLLFTPNCDNIMTCVDTLIGYDLSLPGPSFSTWTGKALYNFTPDTYGQVVTEEVDLHDQKTRGFHFGTTGDQGWVTFAEMAHKTSYAETPYPMFWEAGGWTEHLGVPYTDPLTSVKQYDTDGFGIQGQNIIWRQDGGASNSDKVRRAGVFVRFFASPDESQIYEGQFEVGANLYSPIPSRPYDIIGIKFTNMLLGPHEATYLSRAQIAAGGSPLHQNSQYFEINGHVQITPAIAFEPNLIYALHPDNFISAKTADTRDGWIIGAFFTVNLGRILGLSPAL